MGCATLGRPMLAALMQPGREFSPMTRARRLADTAHCFDRGSEWIPHLNGSSWWFSSRA